MGEPAHIEQLGERIEAVLRRTGDRISCAYLFGSRARDDAHDDSDVDIGVLFREPPSFDERFGLEGELETALGLTVDLVPLNDAPADLVHRVLRDGILLAERDRSHRVRFEVRKRNEYFDMLPIWREYRRLHHDDGEKLR